MADPARARVLQSFFKTGPGQYAAGDVFIGITVPDLRRLARRHAELPLAPARRLLAARTHEARLLALLILIGRFQRGTPAERQRIYRLYLASVAHINNWDLVDLSAPHIVGAHLQDRDRAPIHALAGARSLWARRIAMLATFHFIKRHDFADALAVAARLLAAPEDLLHKAVGWMLREIGKRDLAVEETFLRAHYRRMPRTMLRYAIERFPEPRRQAYLRGTVRPAPGH